MRKQKAEGLAEPGKPNFFKQRAAVKITIAALTVAMITIAVIMAVSSVTILSNHEGKMDKTVFIILMSAAFVFEMLIPFVCEMIFKIRISSAIILVFVIQCFGGTFLGNVANLYWIIPFYNKTIHFLLGLNLSMLGLALIQFFNRKNDGGLNPLFTAAMVLFTGIALCTFWEVFEYIADLLFDMNMQGYYSNEIGGSLVGQAALHDTMIDILLDIAGTAVIAIPTYFSIKFKKNWHKLCDIKKKNSITTEVVMPN